MVSVSEIQVSCAALIFELLTSPFSNFLRAKNLSVASAIVGRGSLIACLLENVCSLALIIPRAQFASNMPPRLIVVYFHPWHIITQF